LKPGIPFLDLRAAQRAAAGEVEAAVERVIASGRYLLGPELERFEHEFAAYCGTRHCVGVGSGLSALELALRAAGVGPGDEVIVPAYTWVATWLAASRAGAEPVGVDSSPDGYCIDPGLIEAAITPRTAAIVPVHLGGQPAEMEAIGSIAADHGLLVLEDAAQAHGASLRGERAGGLGDAAAFSFYPTKNLGALGDGGAVTTDDDAIAERVRLLRNYGMSGRDRMEELGVNSRLAELQAAVLLALLPHLDEWNRARAEIAGLYREALAGAEEIVLPAVPAETDPAWHLFAIGHPDRDGCAAALAEEGIETLVHYPLLPHQSEPYRGSRPAAGFPVAERLAAAEISLPIHPQLEPAAAERVAAAVLATVGEPLST
jgi:dTDP-3-amino-3,4,6-trideoxy-alpha-D-glucose transaminase